MNAVMHMRAQTELATIYEISKILTSSLDVSKTCREALNVLANNMGYRRCMIIVDDEDGELHLLAAVGLSPEEYDAGHYRPGEGIIGKVYSNGMPAVVHDLAAEPFFLNRTGALAHIDGERIALVGMPIRVAKEVVGVITIDRVSERAGGGFNDDVRLLTMTASLVGQALALQRTVVAERNQLISESKRLRQELKGRFRLDNVIGVSKRMQDVFAEVHQAGPSRSTVLLRGESGTGKEAIARAVHFLSPRKDAPFIKVNCAALTESLLESELFGHEKGAFTGAIGERKGRFEMAHGGTLFLDEIGDISPAFQAKLLRVLQEREFERVGGTRPVKVDVRLICATNRDLEKMVQRGDYRLMKEVPITNDDENQELTRIPVEGVRFQIINDSDSASSSRSLCRWLWTMGTRRLPLSSRQSRSCSPGGRRWMANAAAGKAISFAPTPWSGCATWGSTRRPRPCTTRCSARRI